MVKLKVSVCVTCWWYCEWIAQSPTLTQYSFSPSFIHPDLLSSLLHHQVLYMSNNNVKDWAEFAKLAELPNLVELVFVGEYRHFSCQVKCMIINNSCNVSVFIWTAECVCVCGGGSCGLVVLSPGCKWVQSRALAKEEKNLKRSCTIPSPPAHPAVQWCLTNRVRLTTYIPGFTWLPFYRVDKTTSMHAYVHLWSRRDFGPLTTSGRQCWCSCKYLAGFRSLSSADLHV